MAVHYYLDGTIVLEAGEHVAFGGGPEFPLAVPLVDELRLATGNRYRFRGKGQIEAPQPGDALANGWLLWRFDGGQWRLRDEADTCFVEGHVMHAELPDCEDTLIIGGHQ